MKKLIYIILLTVASALSFTSCTDETVEPRTTDNGNGGGYAESDGKR
jgi:hypothetical protein